MVKEKFNRSDSASPVPGAGTNYSRSEGSALANPGSEAGPKRLNLPRSEANPGKIQSSSLEDSINLEMLMQLKSAFSKADKDSGGDLDMEEFVNAFDGVLGKEHGGGSKESLRHMFMKIDANSDGTVDWDEFSTFMLLENQATTSMKEHDRMAQFHEADFKEAPPVPESDHTDIIGRILQMGHNYITCSRDSMVKVWSAKDLALQRSLDTGSAWVTDLAVLPRHNKLAVSTFSRSVSIYDPVSLDLVGVARELDHAVMSMDCWKPESSSNELLVYGDVGGSLQLYRVLDNTEEADTKPSQENQYGLARLWKSHSTAAVALSGGAAPQTPQSHKDWVSKVKYIPDLNSLISCSLDTTLLLSDLDHRSTLRELVGHTKGVYSFDWSETYKFIASCGMDRHVLLWNPFSARPMAQLQGHNSSVMDVIINEKDNQIITVGVDKHIKVWDIRNHRCMQTFVDKSYYRPEDRHSAVIYDPLRRCLVTGTTRLKAWPLRARESGGKSGHVVPVVGALFNHNFNEIVSGDEKGSVCVWDLSTGRLRFRFTRAHGDTKMTAMSFDKHRRRLITGGHDGCVKVWNFSNGACLKTLRGPMHREVKTSAEEEVTAIEYVHGGYHNKHIISVGWDQMVNFWEDNLAKVAAKPNRQLKGHSDDILTVALYPPSLLATGSYDGMIIIWNIESGAVKMKLAAPPLATQPGTPAPAPVPSGPISAASQAEARSVEKLVFLTQRPHILASVSADRQLRLWNVNSGQVLLDLYTGHARGESVVALCKGVGEEGEDRWLCTADSGGFVKVWDISGFTGDVVPEGQEAVACSEHAAWRAHKGSVASVELVEKRGLVVTGSADKSVALWTREGACIGEFGRDRWVIDDASTYREQEASPLHMGAGGQGSVQGSPGGEGAEGVNGESPPGSRPRSPGEVSEVGAAEAGMDIDLAGLELDSEASSGDGDMMLPPETPEMRVAGFVSKLPPRRGGKLPRNEYNHKVYLPSGSPRTAKINHPHVNGRPPTSIAHLIHIHDLGEVAPRPNSRAGGEGEGGGFGGHRGGRRPMSAAVGGGGRTRMTHRERIAAHRGGGGGGGDNDRPHTSMA